MRYQLRHRPRINADDGTQTHSLLFDRQTTLPFVFTREMAMVELEPTEAVVSQLHVSRLHHVAVNSGSRHRTCNLQLKRPLLYRLSYTIQSRQWRESNSHRRLRTPLLYPLSYIAINGEGRT